ncbi:MAG: peptide-methionine (S)-S-oxide reductase MsrA [Alphaproteobacteria bacterium]
MWRWIVGVIVAMVWAHAAMAKTETAVFAGGCFWCVESNFESVSGVIDVISGYTGGASANPTYENHGGHYEAVQITFDPARISYATLVAEFLRSTDVTDAGGQFCDRGASYRSAIFAKGAEQAASAKAAVAAAEAQLGVKVVTPVLGAARFWKAEDYHQDYYKGESIVLTRAGPKKQKNAYTFYRKACGRDARVKAVWGADAAFAH